MINNRLGGGTVYVASGVKEEDISAQIDHGRESTYKARNNLRTSSVMDQERRFRGSVESNPINEESYDSKLDDSMNSDMYMNKQGHNDSYD